MSQFADRAAHSARQTRLMYERGSRSLHAGWLRLLAETAEEAARCARSSYRPREAALVAVECEALARRVFVQYFPEGVLHG